MSYGRHFKETILEPKSDRGEPSCKKCRRLLTDTSPTCSLGRELKPCEEFSDASKQRDYFANFQTGRF